MGAQGAARDVQQRGRWIETEALEPAFPSTREELGTDRVARHHDLPARERGGRRAERHGDAVRESSDQAVRESGHHDLLVDQERPAPHGRRHGGRDCHEPAGGDDDVRLEAAEERERTRETRRHPDREVSHVAPRELAAKLAGRDRVVRNAGRRHPLGLDSRLAADPGQAHAPADSSPERPGQCEARRRVAARPSAGKHDREWPRRGTSPAVPAGGATLPHPAPGRRASPCRRGARARAQPDGRRARDRRGRSPPRGAGRPSSA